MKQDTKLKQNLEKFEGKVTSLDRKAADGFLKFFQKHFLFIFALLATVVSFAVRYKYVYYPTNDVVGFVFSWMKQIQANGFKNFYKVGADYPVLYLFLVGIFTLFPSGEEITVGGFTFYANWMIELKTLLFVLSFFLSFGIYQIVKNVTGNKLKATLGYIVSICLPVQIVNSAVWGNNDVMYAVLMVYAVYFLLIDRDSWSWFLIGICFGVKLQAVFILPFMLYAVLRKKARFYRIYLAFLGLLLTYLPAYICGASFSEPFKIFTTQFHEYQNLHYGSANFWHLVNFKSELNGITAPASTWLGLLFIAVFCALVYLRQLKDTKENLVLSATFFIGIVPYFLPHMHERYLYILDVLTVVYVFTRKKIGNSWLLIAAMQFSSGIAYYHYLSGKYFIQAWGEDSVTLAALVTTGVLLYLFAEILKAERDVTFLKEESEEPVSEERKEDAKIERKEEISHESQAH